MMKFLDDEGREGTGSAGRRSSAPTRPVPPCPGRNAHAGRGSPHGRNTGATSTGSSPRLPRQEEAIENALADHLGDPYERGDWDDRLEPSVGDHGLFHCGCGWKSSVPDIGEWRRHMADAILAELAEVRERG